MYYFERISPAEGAQLIHSEPNLRLFDVRDLPSYAAGHIEGAMSLDEGRVGAWISRLEKDTPILIYCYHGNSSQSYAKMFSDFHFSRVYSVDGGYRPLERALQAVAPSQAPAQLAEKGL